MEAKTLHVAQMSSSAYHIYHYTIFILFFIAVCRPCRLLSVLDPPARINVLLERRVIIVFVTVEPSLLLLFPFHQIFYGM